MTQSSVAEKITLKARVANEILCEKDPEAKALNIAMCKRDCVYWINWFAWTYNPRLKGQITTIPFIMFPKQEEYIRELVWCIENGEDIGVEKSRELGVSWLTCAVFVWFWLFKPNQTFLVGSMTETKVYKSGEPDSLYWKLEFLATYQPAWLIPKGFNRTKHITFMSMVNPENGSTINGQAPTSNFGRSGRKTASLFDELQGWEVAEEAWNANSFTTDCRIAVGTPDGMNFYGKLMNPPPGKPALRKFILDWRDDERKNEWIAYDKKPRLDEFDIQEGCLTEGFRKRAVVLGRGSGWGQDAPAGTKHLEYPWHTWIFYRKFLGDKAWMAQEVDRDYKRSVKGRVYPQSEYIVQGRFFYNPEYPTYVAMDVGADMTAVGWFQWNWRERRFVMIDYLQKPDKTIDWFIPFFTGRVPTGVMSDEYDQEDAVRIRYHAGWSVDAYFGDPSGKATGQVVDMSPYDALAAYGIDVQTNDLARGFGTRINSARKLMVILSVDSVACSKWIEAIENYRWPDRGENSNSTGAKDKPIHNEHSHGATMFEYFCVNVMDIYQELLQIDPFSEAGPDAQASDVLRRTRAYASEREDHVTARGVTGYGD